MNITTLSNALRDVQRIRADIERLYPSEHGGSKHHPLIKDLEAALAMLGIHDARSLDAGIPTVSDITTQQDAVVKSVTLVREYYRIVETPRYYLLD